MRVNFRQGVVGHQTGSFLNINGSGHVDLLAANRAFTVNLAHKTTNYIHSEDNTVSSAWVGPFVPTSDYWLYIDFNRLTFLRTFGTTTLEPVSQSSEPGAGDVDSSNVPLLTDGRHWFDTSTGTHYVLNGGNWTEVIRVFVAQLSNTTFLSMSINAPSFVGTQIGNVSSVLAGRPLFNESFEPLLKDDGTFVTTEDQFFTNQSRTDGIRLESNVSKAQNTGATLAEFTVVSYIGDGEVQTAQYDDTSDTVLGLLTESIAAGEVGSVVLQGVVTNPAWDWLSLTTVGSEMWVENGLLVFVDPHVADPVTYPQGKVPVARVLSRDSVIFEQGLGGKGDKGPVGSVANLPPATVSEIGGCTLVSASSDPAQAFVISDTDPRLSDSRNPLPHIHTAADITFVPGFGLASNNIQNATEELAIEKLNIAGGTMTGALTLFSNPTGVLEAATKQYVDNLVSGLIWLDPVDKVNLIADDVATPPVSPEVGDAYIIPVGATGDWSAFASGNITTWDGTVWVDDGPVTGFASLPRFGIAFSSSATPSGSFAGQKNNIALYDGSGVLTGFEVPVNNNAVYVRNPLSQHAFDQYAFSTSWTLFSSGQDLVPDGTTIEVNGNVVSVVPFSTGGEVDAKFWQGLEPTDLDTTYAPLIHVHTGATISLTAYNTSPDWGTLTNTSNEITSAQVQLATQDLVDSKAAKLPTYATQAHRPAAANVEGMIVYVQDIQRSYVASNGAWIPLVKENDTINLPYDLAFYVAGGMQTDNLVGSFLIARQVDIKTGAAGSLAIADQLAVDGTYTLDIVHRPTPTFTPVVVGTIAFSIGVAAGVITWGSDISFAAGDMLQIRTPLGTPDSNLEDLSITLVGCAPTIQCTI